MRPARGRRPRIDRRARPPGRAPARALPERRERQRLGPLEVLDALRRFDPGATGWDPSLAQDLREGPLRRDRSRLSGGQGREGLFALAALCRARQALGHREEGVACGVAGPGGVDVLRPEPGVTPGRAPFAVAGTGRARVPGARSPGRRAAPRDVRLSSGLQPRVQGRAAVAERRANQMVLI